MPEDTDDIPRRLDDVTARLDETLVGLHEIQAGLDATTAEWNRRQAAGEILMLPELTRRLKALEARVAQLEGRTPEEPTP